MTKSELWDLVTQVSATQLIAKDDTWMNSCDWEEFILLMSLKNPQSYGAQYTTAYSYGFGGGGGVLVQNTPNVGTTGTGGYLTVAGDIGSTLGNGAFLLNVNRPNHTPVATDNGQITNANYVINGVRQPSVAGGGGGGGVLTNNSAGPPGTGGDGVVRIKIVTK
jgi:hypothetical protein